MPKRYSIADARNQLPALVHAVADHGPVELTRRGRPVAVLVSIADYQKLCSGRPDLWSGVARFREETDLGALDLAAALDEVRDRSIGRDLEL